MTNHPGSTPRTTVNKNAMTAGEVADAAWALGFDAVAALEQTRTLAVLATWYARGKGNPYQPEWKSLVMEAYSAQAVLLLAYPYALFTSYPSGVGRVSAYYAASNAAYHATRTLIKHLHEHSVTACPSRLLPLKPLARAAGIGDYGRNGLIVRQGSHCVLQALLIDMDAAHFPSIRCEPMICARCGRCEQACPSGALQNGIVDTARCLRSYMEGGAVPMELAPLLGDRLLGCDECLAACPGKPCTPLPSLWTKLFAFDALTNDQDFARNKRKIAAVIGRNYVNIVHRAALWHKNLQ